MKELVTCGDCVHGPQHNNTCRIMDYIGFCTIGRLPKKAPGKKPFFIYVGDRYKRTAGWMYYTGDRKKSDPGWIMEKFDRRHTKAMQTAEEIIQANIKSGMIPPQGC